MTVAQIKEKVKPTVELLKSKPPSKRNKASSSSALTYPDPRPSTAPSLTPQAKAPPTGLEKFSQSPQVAEMERQYRQNQAQFQDMTQQVASVLDTLTRPGGLHRLQTQGEMPENFSLAGAAPMQVDSILNGEERPMSDFSEAELRQLAGESMESVYQERLEAQYGDLDFVDLATKEQVEAALDP